MAPPMHITALRPRKTHSKTGGGPPLPLMMAWMLSAMLRGGGQGEAEWLGRSTAARVTPHSPLQRLPAGRSAKSRAHSFQHS